MRSDCRPGERVTVQGVSDDDAPRLRELQRRGLTPGTRIEVLKGSEYESPIEGRCAPPRSSSWTVRRLTPARAASARWLSPALRR